MGRWALTNGNGYDTFPESVDDLRRGLSELDALARIEGRPRVAVLTSDSGAEDVPYLSLGVGSDDTVVVFEPGNDEQQGGYSRGTRMSDVSPVTFAYGTGSTEYLAWMVVPSDAAFAAAVEFFRTGKRPTSIEWEDL